MSIAQNNSKCGEWVVRLVSRGYANLSGSKKGHSLDSLNPSINIIIGITENQELQRNPMKSSDSRTNSKYKSPYGCRTNSHCVLEKECI